MSDSKWWDIAWNPVTGCTPVSAGCDHCWARRMAIRFDGPGGFKVTPHPLRLHTPLRRKKPKIIFVCNMGDLFHEDVTENIINTMMCFMRVADYHTFFLLTKRPERMAKYLENLRSKDLVIENLWIGTSVEDQQTADERIPILLSIPGYKKFISVEPMLGPIDLSRWICRGHRGCEDWGICHGKEKNDCIYNALPYEGLLDWVICGAETGPGARMTDLSWARMLKEQCTAAGVPFFFKSAGRRIEIPDDLKTREYPIMGAKNDPGPR